MKNRTFLFALLLTLCGNTFGQSYKIQYSTIEYEKSFQSNLIVTDSFSLWQTDSDAESSIGKDRFVYKDKIINTVFFNEILFGKPFFIKDSLYNMKWVLNDENKEILGLKCNTAKTIFRGREYIAHYTTDIHLSDGPWKFGNLPGLILEIHSIDNLFSFTAIKIEKNNLVAKKENQLEKHSFINWEKYTMEFKITVDNIIKMLKTKVEKGDKANFRMEGKEIIYPEVQTGEGITIEQ